MTQLTPHRLELAEYRSSLYRCESEAGTKIEEVLEEKYWAHVSAKLRRGDRIIVQAEDDAFYAELLVLDAGKLYAKIAKLVYIPLYEDLKDASLKAGEFSIQWRGPKERWCGFCADDLLVPNMTKDAAVAWLRERVIRVEGSKQKNSKAA